MTITQNAWTHKTRNGFMVATCTFASDASLYDTYTLKIPANLIDGTKPWLAFFSAAATIDAQATPLEIWVGYDDNFELTGDTPTLATSGGMFKELTSDIRLAVLTVEHVFLMHPDLGVADVVTIGAIATGYKANVPASPYYAFAINGGSAISADLITVNVVQRQ